MPIYLRDTPLEKYLVSVDCTNIVVRYNLKGNCKNLNLTCSRAIESVSVDIVFSLFCFDDECYFYKDANLDTGSDFSVEHCEALMIETCKSMRGT